MALSNVYYTMFWIKFRRMEVVSKNIFDSNCEYIVNTINTVGAMGAGLALEYRLRVPRMYNEYVRKCKVKEIEIGKYWIYSDMDRICKKILNFPTKKHFIHKSKHEYLYQGLLYFRENYRRDNITSIAFPILGARQGKLNRDNVLLIMRDLLDDLPIEIEICESKFSDRFTITVKNLLESMSIEEISDNFRIHVKTAEKLKHQLKNVRFLSEIVTFDIVSVQTAERIYDYFFRKLSKMDLFNYK